MVAEIDESGRFGAEIGADHAGLESDGVDPGFAVAALQFAGEEDIAEFCPSVGAERGVIVLALGVGGVEVGSEQVGGDRRGLDNGGVRGGEFVEEQAGQKKLREHVDLKGALEAVLGQFPLVLRAARVVRQNVDPLVCVQFPGEPHDVGEFGVIGKMELAAEFVGCPLGFFGVASDEDHVLPRFHERTRRGGADPVAAPGDDDGFFAFVFHKNSFAAAAPNRGGGRKIYRFSN